MLTNGSDLTADQLTEVRTAFVNKASEGWIKTHRFWVLDGAVLPRAARHINEPDTGWRLP